MDNQSIINLANNLINGPNDKSKVHLTLRGRGKLRVRKSCREYLSFGQVNKYR